MSIGMFDVIGPITVGPSSSHTAGAVRIGLICRTLIGADVEKAVITFYGSFADTYKGHGTDKAVIGGLLGFSTEEEKVRDSLLIAEETGFKYELKTADESRFHPNTVYIEATGKNGVTMKLRGASIGGGAIRITGINGSEINASCTYDTAILFHRDEHGLLADIAQIISDGGVNIGNLRLARTRRDGDVITIVETDEAIDQDTIEQLKQVSSVSNVIAIPKF